MSDLEFVFINKDHNNFIEKVEKNIKNYLPKDYKNAEVLIQETIKNNDEKLTGLLVKKPEQNIGLRIYIDNYYKEHLEGADFEEIIKGIANDIVSCEIPNFDVKQIYDYENIKSKLKIQLCDPELNSNNIKDKPFTQVGDLAALYKVNVFSDERGQGIMPVTSQMLDVWKVDVHKLHQDALNSPIENKYCLHRMEDIIGELVELSSYTENLLEKTRSEISPDEDRMYVLTNNTRTDGASALINEKVMKKVGELIGSCYVIPSSIHECILIPDDGMMKAEELEKMIGEVNLQELLPNEILSYKAQYYDADFNILENAREHENPVSKTMGKRLHRQNPDRGIGR